MVSKSYKAQEKGGWAFSVQLPRMVLADGRHGPPLPPVPARSKPSNSSGGYKRREQWEIFLSTAAGGLHRFRPSATRGGRGFKM